jgi:recombination protein RecA
MAGIPMGKMVEISGLESTGKSYLATQIAANAVKKGIDVVYFDAESALDMEFASRMGLTPDDFIYVQATSVEFVLETIETLLSENNKPMLFILDSLAQTPTKTDIESDYDPLSSMAVKARVLSKGFQKLTIPLANNGSTFLVLNQLKTNITNNVAEKFTDPFTTPGGKALLFACSLRIWLTSRHSKASFVVDENGTVIGTEVKVHIKKSRFGSFGRECVFKILWAGDRIAIQDEESFYEVIKDSPEVNVAGAWCSLKYADGIEEKFQQGGWVKKMADPKFKERVIEIMDKLLIKKYEKVEETK